MKKNIASLDFDGTLRLDGTESQCMAILNSLPESIINVINTGRGITLLQEKIHHYFQDEAIQFNKAISHYICNNGSDIYYKNGYQFETLKEWSAHLSDQWDRSVLLERLSPLAQELQFDLFPEVYNFKLLYYFHRKNFLEADAVINLFKAAIANLPVFLVYAKSSQKPPEGLMKFVCEIFPQKAGKGNALLFLKNYLESQNQLIESISRFGDDRNDFQTVVEMPLFYEWWNGCLVGNSTDWIINKAEGVRNSLKGQIIIAPPEYPGPAGVEWIMKKLNWF